MNFPIKLDNLYAIKITESSQKSSKVFKNAQINSVHNKIIKMLDMSEKSLIENKKREKNPISVYGTFLPINFSIQTFI